MNQTITVNGTEYTHTYERGSEWLKIIHPFVVAVDLRDMMNLKFFLDEGSDRSITRQLNDDLPLMIEMLMYEKA